MSGVLGCADTYSARVHFRGGEQAWISLEFGIASVTWDRRMNDTSEAQVVVAKAGVDQDCYARLARTEPWTHELTLYRVGDGLGGGGGPLFWQGPIRRVEETANSFIVDARDMTAWFARRTNKFAYKYTNAYLSEIADRLITYAIRVDDPNLLDYMRIDTIPVRTSREQERADQVIVGDEVSSMVPMGLCFTAIGRRVWIYPTVTLATRAQGRISDTDILDEISLVQDGDLNATRWVVQGDGVAGRAGGGSPYFGLLEQIASSENTTSAACVTEARTRLAWSRNPPTIVTVPEGARLAPTTPITLERLVAGQRIDVATTQFTSTAATAMCISQVGGSWTPGSGEQITISLTPIGTLVEQADVGLTPVPRLPNPETGLFEPLPPDVVEEGAGV